MNADTAVDHTSCSISGCPLAGSISRSTNGGDWLCFAHFSAPARHQHAVTMELQRMGWLATLTRELRRGGGEKLYQHAQREIALSQRGDLQKSEKEAHDAWVLRLENILSQSCKDCLPAE